MRLSSRNLTILLNDIVGSTSMIAHRSRQAMMDLLQTFDELMRPVIHHYGGRIVKTIGDAYMTVFESPTDAVLCAIRMQYVLRGYNKARAESDQIHVRIALNSGEVQIAGDGDVFGEAVNLTARVAGVTEADQIYLTEQVYLIMNRNEVPDTLAVKKFSFKGIAEEVTIYRVIQNEDNAVYSRIVGTQIRPPDPAPAGRPPNPALRKMQEWGALAWSLLRRHWIGVGVAGLVLLFGAYFLHGRGQDRGTAASSSSPRPRATASTRAAPHADAPEPRATAPLRLTAPKLVGEEVAQAAEMLLSPDDNEVRDAATRLVRSRVTDPKVFKTAADALLKGCTERPGNEVHADAMGWLCNLLGQSEGMEYVATLEQVAERTPHAKVKRYAISNADSLKRRAARPHP